MFFTDAFSLFDVIYISENFISLFGKIPGLNKLKINAISKGLLIAGVPVIRTILVSSLSLFSC